MTKPQYLAMSNADPEKQRAKLLARRVIDDSGCWVWPGTKTLAGYGQMRIGPPAGQKDYVHRISHRLFIGPIPEGADIDHLCRNRSCYNPEHLEAVTHRVNVLRGEAPGAVAHVTDTCHRGHSLADAYVTKSGHRRCRPCLQAWQSTPEQLAKQRERHRARRARDERRC